MNRAGQRRRQAAVVLAGFCAFFDLYAPQPLLPMLKSLFHVSTSEISELISVSTLAVAVIAPLIGFLADRYGRKRVIVPSAILLSFPTILAATSRGFGDLLLWRFLQGIFTPGIFAATVAYIQDEWTDGVGAAVAAYVTGTVLGGFCGRLLAAEAGVHFSWRVAFVLLGSFNLMGGIAIWAWLPDDRNSGSRTAAKNEPGGFLIHLRNARLMATCAAGFCVLFTIIATFTYVNFYLAAPPFEWSTSALGFLFTVYLAGAAVTPIGGRAIDRFSHRSTTVTALFGSILGMLITLIHSGAAVIVGLALCCGGAFVAQAAASSFIGIAAYRARAAAVGWYVTFYYAGGSFGAAIPGYFWNRGGWPACVALVIFVQIVTIVIASLFWRYTRLHHETAVAQNG